MLHPKIDLYVGRNSYPIMNLQPVNQISLFANGEVPIVAP